MADPAGGSWGYAMLKWVIGIAALLFAVIWFLGAVSITSKAPDWVPPTSVLCLAVAVLLP